MGRFFIIYSYVKYLFCAGNEHGLHPPYIYSFYTRIIRRKEDLPENRKNIEALRQNLQKNRSSIPSGDWGATSLVSKKKHRSIGEIVRYSCSEPEVSALLWRIGNSMDQPVIIELGTSAGVNTLYLSQIENAHVYSLEGSGHLLEIAGKNIRKEGKSPVDFIEGNIDLTLPHLLKTIDKADLIFFDANHHYEPTLRYFHLCLEKAQHSSVFVFDDIHWSPEMEKAWQEIKNHPKVSLSIDLFKVGIVIFAPLLKKQHYVLHF